MCNNLSVSKKTEMPGNGSFATPTGSSNQLCPVHSGNRVITRSLSMEDLHFYGGGREMQRTRSRRRKSTQVCRENSKKAQRVSTRRARSSYHEPPHFLNFENEIIRIINSSRRTSLEIPRQELLRNNSQRSSRKDSYSSYYPRMNSVCSYRRKPSLSPHLPEEELLKHKKRRKLVTVIIVTFGILVFVCIMAVIVSLTHRSTVTVTKNNSTVNVTYYTFSPHAGIVCEFEDGRLCSKGK